jgi:hypothetical protein
MPRPEHPTSPFCSLSLVLRKLALRLTALMALHSFSYVNKLGAIHETVPRFFALSPMKGSRQIFTEGFYQELSRLARLANEAKAFGANAGHSRVREIANSHKIVDGISKFVLSFIEIVNRAAIYRIHRIAARWPDTYSFKFSTLSEKSLRMTTVLVALVGVLPLAVAGLALLFVSGSKAPKSADRYPINLCNLK